MTLTFIWVMLWSLLWFFVVTYGFWLHYLIYSAYKGARDAGRRVPLIAEVLVLFVIVPGFVIDVVYNAIFGSLIFLEWPEYWTLTERCSTHITDGLFVRPPGYGTSSYGVDFEAPRIVRYRGTLARWLCHNLLDPFQSGGHCRQVTVT